MSVKSNGLYSVHPYPEILGIIIILFAQRFCLRCAQTLFHYEFPDLCTCTDARSLILHVCLLPGASVGCFLAGPCGIFAVQASDILQHGQFWRCPSTLCASEV